MARGVIQGALSSLEFLGFIFLQVSYTEIYKENPLSQETRGFLGDLGFQRYKEAPGYYPERGDTIYVRANSKAARELNQCFSF